MDRLPLVHKGEYERDVALYNVIISSYSEYGELHALYVLLAFLNCM
jgi:hypothetical protein